MLKRICAVTVLALVVTAVPASASSAVSGVADAGSADYVRNGSPVVIPAVARCDINSPTSNSAELTTGSGVRFGSGTSSCAITTVDPDSDTTKTVSTASGTEFELSALVPVGGPRVRFSGYQATCTGTKGRTNVNWSFSGLSGLSALPSPVPRNYVREIRKFTGALLATATFNEITVPSPNDGSIALTMMRIRFEPASGMTGEVRVGHAACSPTP